MADSSKRQRVDPIDRYDIGELLGEGAFATVRRATRKSDGTAFAIKLIEKESTSADDAEHERKILSALGLHRHIVSLVDSFDVSDATAFVLELAEEREGQVAQLRESYESQLLELKEQAAASRSQLIIITHDQRLKDQFQNTLSL